jgi:MFS family permease
LCLAAAQLHLVCAMTLDSHQTATRQSYRFLGLYALAISGGAVAYVPFLTILLPLRVTELNAGSAMNTLAYAAFFGAITASLSNIGFGWLSDITKSRQPWIIAGMVLSSSLLALMPLAQTSIALIAMIVCWQVFLNMMLAPLSAWAGDLVPNSQKGLLGGFLAFGPAIGAFSGTLITFQGGAEGAQRFWLVAVMAVALVTPVLVLGRPVAMPHLAQTSLVADLQINSTRPNKAVVMQMWLARLCVQIAEASLFAFLLMWFRSLDKGFGENQAATIFAVTLSMAIIATLLVGRWSDRHQKPILPLVACAFGASVGLMIMASAQSLQWAIGGYVVFGLMGGMFLSLHTSQTLAILPSAQFRGRDLGIFNLTNTVPSLVMPWLILALVPLYGFGALFVVLAGLALVAGALLVTIPRLNRS